MKKIACVLLLVYLASVVVLASNKKKHLKELHYKEKEKHHHKDAKLVIKHAPEIINTRDARLQMDLGFDKKVHKKDKKVHHQKNAIKKQWQMKKSINGHYKFI